MDLSYFIQSQRNVMQYNAMSCLHFYRLMSGLQSSISIHIARQYYFPDGRWDTNMPLFVRAVGSHPDRLSNLYFTFLVVLRSVVKAGDFLTSYPFRTGNTTDDEAVHRLIQELVTARIPNSVAGFGGGDAHGDALEGMPLVRRRIPGSRKKLAGESEDSEETSVLEECRNGFDESALFQVKEVGTYVSGDISYGPLTTFLSNLMMQCRRWV
jgi:hypothetical protein